MEEAAAVAGASKEEPAARPATPLELVPLAPGELLYLVECSYSRDDRTVARSVGEVAFVSVEVRACARFHRRKLQNERTALPRVTHSRRRTVPYTYYNTRIVQDILCSAARLSNISNAATR